MTGRGHPSAASELKQIESQRKRREKRAIKGGLTPTGKVLNIRGNITGVASLYLGSREIFECGICQVD
jgi:hypothetical protein